MPKKSTIPLEPVALRLYSGDKDVLKEFYPELGYNSAVREIVHRHVKALRERATRQGVTDNERLTELADAVPLGDLIPG